MPHRRCTGLLVYSLRSGMKPLRQALSAAAVLLLAGCATPPPPAADFNPLLVEHYRLDSGDDLRIIVFGQDDPMAPRRRGQRFVERDLGIVEGRGHASVEAMPGARFGRCPR